VSELRHPKAGEFWLPKFESHAPYHVAGYDPVADRVFRMLGGRVFDLASGWDTLQRLHAGWHPPTTRYPQVSDGSGDR